MQRVPSYLAQLSNAITTGLLILITLTTCTTTSNNTGTGIHKIQHVVVIMQENRSFDSYFGTYRGADGIPMHNGVVSVCVNDPAPGQCSKPFLDSHDKNGGGPHDETAAAADTN